MSAFASDDSSTAEGSTTVSASVSTLRSQLLQFIKQQERVMNSPCAVAIVHDGKLVLSEGFGWSNRRLHASVTPHTLFDFGELSRSFVALGVALQAERNRLNLKAPVRQDFPGFEWDTPEATKNLTWADLIVIPEDRSYAVLQAAIEKTSALNWSRFVEAEIRRPLELNDLSSDAKKGSVTDLGRWMALWMNRGTLPSGERWLSEASFSGLLRAWSVKNPSAETGLVYVLAGRSRESTSLMALSPEQNIGVAVLTAADQPELGQAIASFVLSGHVSFSQ